MGGMRTLMEPPATLLPADVRAERGVRQLPASLPEAVERLSTSSVLREAMGEVLFKTFVATRRGECEQYAGLADDELIRRLRWRY